MYKMKLIVCTCFLLLGIGTDAIFFDSKPSRQDHILDSSLCDWIRSWNYECCVYEVVTKDNYILTVHRINGRFGNATRKMRKYPILFSHGLLTSGRDWTYSGKPFSIAFELADCDFDVWMVSHRGTDLSNRNTKICRRDPRFYNFSFNEMGKYDLPAVIDFILFATKCLKIIHASFSQGGASFFVMYSDLPDYTSKHVELAICMAPAAYIHESSNIMAYAFVVADYQSSLRMALANHQINAVAPLAFKIYVLARLCIAMYKFDRQNMNPICSLVFAILVDYNYKYTTDPKVVAYVIASTLRITSTKQIFHLTQNAQVAKFCRYRSYPSQSCEEYNLRHQNVTTRIEVFMSCHDHFVPYPNRLSLRKVKNICMHYVDGLYHTNLVFDMGNHNDFRRKYFSIIVRHSPYINKDDEARSKCRKYKLIVKCENRT